MAPYDVVVVGAGPTGAATAIHLARAGRRVVLFEKDGQPGRKACGEGLFASGAAELIGLGLDLGAVGAWPLPSIRFHANGRTVAAPLAGGATAVRRERLAPAFWAAAVQAGVELRAGCAVRSV